MTLAVTLTVEELGRVVKAAVDAAFAAHAEPDAVLTREAVAEMLDCSPHQVTNLVRAKGLPGHRFGSEWRFRRSEVLAWISAQEGAK